MKCYNTGWIYMVSVAQNFICTKEKRLKVINRNTIKLGKVFSDNDFFIMLL